MPRSPFFGWRLNSGNDFIFIYWGENGIAFARFLAVILSFPTIFYTEKRFLGNVQVSFWLQIY